MSLLGDLLAGSGGEEQLSAGCAAEDLEEQLDDLRAELYELELHQADEDAALWGIRYRELGEKIGALEALLGG